MDGECGRVEGPVAVDDLAVVVDEDQVLDADLFEVHPERVHPEMVEQLGVSGGDVTRHPFVESKMPEQAKGGGEALLAVPSLVLDVVERGKLRRKTV